MRSTFSVDDELLAKAATFTGITETPLWTHERRLREAAESCGAA